MIAQKFKIRWALDYADGRTKRGLWTSQPDVPGTRASMQSREGLIKARIEARDVCGGEVLTVAELAAHEWTHFAWVSATLVKGFVGKGGTIIGIEMHSNKGICVGFYTDGQCIVENYKERKKPFDRQDVLGVTPGGIIQRSK